MHQFESDTINRLAAKLDGLSLTDDERAALDAIIDRAADGGDDVSGFAYLSAGLSSSADQAAMENQRKVKPLDLNPGAGRIADALGPKLR